ncbi:FAD-dependent oxidoreductase [Paraglaciecola sp. L3A3]|uniref:FAD-dependent oxidoreductase n=1 Tax=Paraglaciecola sp. L3A3 TaxID=2686358 RepID=UPI00131E082E|nr:FAD-dependent oxidoreductase [Paraglaciecola sp. L3A3]
MQSVDIVIVGGGVVGLTQALALQESGLSVAVVESHVSENMPSGEPQLRVSALTVATQTVLQNIGAWQHLDPSRMSRYLDMYVWDQDSFANIDFKSAKVESNELGYILENQSIRHALWLQAEQSSFIQLLAPKKIENLVFGQQECFITLNDGSHLTARLVIGADGANSLVKKQANLVETFWDYEQHAIVATIKTELPHQNIARQVFTASGPLAFLPLWDGHYCSIVWSQDEPISAELMALDKAEFEKALTVAFDGQLGLCELVSEKQAYPLKMRYSRQWLDDRVVIVGDAAHTLHPLAGQGANLGILDAAALAEQINKLVSQDKDFGLAKNLRPFERWRKTEAVKMIAAMEGFKRLFAGEKPVKKLFRDIGLAAVNQIPMVKQSIIKQAMGLAGELPKLAKK